MGSVNKAHQQIAKSIQQLIWDSRDSDCQWSKWHHAVLAALHDDDDDDDDGGGDDGDGDDGADDELLQRC